MNKRGQLGLGTVRSVMLAFLILAVIGIAIILAMVSLRDVAEDIDTLSSTLTNETFETVVNETGAYVVGTTLFRNCVLTADTYSLLNATQAYTIETANYTIDGCLVQFSGTTNDQDSGWNNTLINVTGSYTYSAPTSNDLSSNISVSIEDFFSNTGTIFSILVVVVIILAIAIIIAVVSRFGSGGGAGGGVSMGSKRDFGSETVGGI